MKVRVQRVKEQENRQGQYQDPYDNINPEIFINHIFPFFCIRMCGLIRVPGQPE